MLKHYSESPSGPDALRRTTVTLDFPNILAGAYASLTFPFPGCTVDDLLWASLLTVPTGIEIVNCCCLVKDVATLTVRNTTAAPIDPPVLNVVAAALL